VDFRFSEENATTQRNLERVSAQDRVNVSGTRRHALVPTLLAAGVTAPVLDEHQKPMRRGASTAKLTAASNCRPRRCSSAWGTPRSPSRWTCTATCSRAATTEPSWRRRKWRCWRSYSRVVRPEQDLLSARRDHPPVRPRLCRRQCSHMRLREGILHVAGRDQRRARVWKGQPVGSGGSAEEAGKIDQGSPWLNSGSGHNQEDFERRDPCDPAHPLALLRPRRERPRSRTAEQRDELAASHRFLLQLSPPEGRHPPGLSSMASLSRAASSYVGAALTLFILYTNVMTPPTKQRPSRPPT